MTSMNKKNKSLAMGFGILGIIIMILPFFAGPYARIIGRAVISYMILALSWDILIRSGQLSFGLAGLFGLGGYISVILSANFGIPGLLSIVLAGVIVGIIAAVIGAAVLRLRGMYFAITTMAFGEIFKIIMHNWKSVSGGPNGKILQGALFQGDSNLGYALMLILALLVILLSEYFKRSRYHFALTAIRDNEVTAKSGGINIYTTLVFTFVVTSMVQGVAGAANSQLIGFVSPESSFNANYTLIPLAMALLGGMYGTWGPVVGAVLLGVLGEFLKLYIPYGHLVVYGLIIILVLLFMPQGIVGLIKRHLFVDTGNDPLPEEKAGKKKELSENE